MPKIKAKKMTEEMIEVAYDLLILSKKYRNLYKKHNEKNDPVVWIQNEETGECVFISDSYNGQRIKDIINE